MPMTIAAAAAIVVPIGPGREAALDTLDSVAFYCPEPHVVVIIDDCTQDGTYEALRLHQRPNWVLLRNSQPMGVHRLVHSLCAAYRFILSETHCQLVLRLDQDALIIKPGVLSDALAYHREIGSSGLFGVYDRDYNRPRSFEAHRRLMQGELRWYRKLIGLYPYWTGLLRMAEARGYKLGDNVFGGAYFVTRPCLKAMEQIGALQVPYSWHSRLMEDVYFSMAAVATGFHLGHFAAPDGPLCLEWQGLPFPAQQFAGTPYKIVHSEDKGQNTDIASNNGISARQAFRCLREQGSAPLQALKNATP